MFILINCMYVCSASIASRGMAGACGGYLHSAEHVQGVNAAVIGTLRFLLHGNACCQSLRVFHLLVLHMHPTRAAAPQPQLIVCDLIRLLITVPAGVAGVVPGITSRRRQRQPATSRAHAATACGGRGPPAAVAAAAPGAARPPSAPASLTHRPQRHCADAARHSVPGGGAVR